jgi:hypothetical protein
MDWQRLLAVRYWPSWSVMRDHLSLPACRWTDVCVCGDALLVSFGVGTTDVGKAPPKSESGLFRG